MAPRITEVVNNRDGSTVTVRLAEAAGAPIFYASRAPAAVADYLVDGSTGFPNNRSVASEVPIDIEGGMEGANGYVLRLVPEGEGDGARWPFFIRVTDDGESSALVPVVVCKGTDADLLTEVSRALSDILVAYKPVLDLRLENVSPVDHPVRVQGILSGFSYNAERFPVIDVTTASWSEDIFQMSGVTVVGKIGATISCYAFHASSVSWRPFIAALGFAVRDVLNQDHLLELQLPSGLVLTKCFVSSVEVGEIQDGPGDKYFTVATLKWEADVHIPLV